MFSATQDTVDDDGESVKIARGTLPSGIAEGSNKETVVSITDDDLPEIKAEFSASTHSVAEGSSVTITVELSAAPERGVTIPINHSPQGGATDADYSSIPDPGVAFGAAETSKTFSFTATNDTLDDDGESVKLTFGTLPERITEDTTKETVVTIVDNDDPEIKVSFQSATLSVAEGATIHVQVNLSAAPERDVTIGISSAVQDGTSSSDYTVDSSITFTANQTVKTFAFTATHDTVDDDGEKVKLTFTSNLSNRITEDTIKETVVSIIDDDVPTITASFAAGTYSVDETDDPDTTEVTENEVIITVTQSAAPERTVTIPITKTDQGGASSADYSGVPADVTFNSGETTKTFTFTAAHDTTDDDGESVKLTFGTMPTLVTEGTTKETVVSINDDVPPVTVSYGASSYTVAEGSSVSVKVKLSADPERTVEVPIVQEPFDGASTSDYSGVPATVTFNTRDTEKTFSFTATQDTVDDDGEKVKLTFGTLPTRVTSTGPSQAIVSITDDHDPEVNADFGQAAYTVAEGNSVTVEVTLSANPERTVTVGLTKTNEGTTTNGDYSGVPASVVFNSGETEKTFSFSATADDIADNGEKVKLEFDSLPDRVSEGTTKTSTITITDDDVAGVNISPATLTIVEGKTGTYTVTLATEPVGDVTVAIAGTTNTDLSVNNTSLTFTSDNWDTPQTITVTAQEDDDTADEAAVTITNTASSDDDDTYDSVAAGSLEVTVMDNDTEGVSVSPTSLTVTEGQTATYTIVLTTEPADDVTITINDPTDNSDVTAGPASLTFTSDNWDTAQTVTVSAAHDTDADDETATVTHTVADYGGVTAANVAVSVEDDAPDTVKVNFDQAAYSVEEGETVNVKVTLDDDPERTVTIPLSHPGTGAATSADYTGVPASVVFNTGETEKQFTITATDDTLDDDDETIRISLGTLPDDATAGTTNTITVSIDDNDDPEVKVSFEATTHSVNEGDSKTIKVKLDADSERTVVILLSVDLTKAPETTTQASRPASLSTREKRSKPSASPPPTTPSTMAARP